MIGMSYIAIDDTQRLQSLGFSNAFTKLFPTLLRKFIAHYRKHFEPVIQAKIFAETRNN